MKLEFQDEVIRFLVQSKEAKKYLEFLDSDLFDLQERQIVFDLIKGYQKEFKSIPTVSGLLEYFDKEARSKNISKEVYNKLESVIRSIYDPLETNTQQIRDSLIEYYQRKLGKQFIKDYSAQVKAGDKELFYQMGKEMNRISKLSESQIDDEQNRGDFLLKDHQVGNYSIVEGSPTYIKALNKLTAVKGFYSPQLIIVMGGPKSFKTGTMLNLAVNYVRDGKKVYYADCENGKDRIRDRARQCMLECSFEDLISGMHDETLTEMVRRFQAMGGDFKADFYPAYTKTIADVEVELEYLRDEFNWIPDIICYDGLDHFKPIDRSIKEKRFMLTAVYFDAINLQNKWGMFGLSVSQVNRQAVSKKVMDMTAFAEDFAKAANCHAAFALCSTPLEQEAGVTRIVPVVQRDGVPYQGKNLAFVKVDAKNMSVKEISIKDAEKMISVVSDKFTSKEKSKEESTQDVKIPKIFTRPTKQKLKNPLDEA